MAAKGRKPRPPAGVDRETSKLNMSTLYDLMCPICQSIFIEPVTLPCNHNFCLSCFNETVENNALACPLCRMRIGSWLRTSRKRNKVVNIELWDSIKSKFESEINAKLNGVDVTCIEEEKSRILSAPGEIKSEYEKEIRRVINEKKLLEEKHLKESEKLIRELQAQEMQQSEEVQKRLHQDEMFAKQLAENSQNITDTCTNKSNGKQSFQTNKSCDKSLSSLNPKSTKTNHTSSSFYHYFALNNNAPQPNNKSAKINTLDKYIIKARTPTSSNSIDCTISSPPSPELISTAGKCGRFIKKFLTNRLWGSGINSCSSVSSKSEPKVWDPQDMCAGHSCELSVNTGVKQYHKQSSVAQVDNSLAINDDSFILDTYSEDSLAQELCYFKPLHVEPVTSFSGKCEKIIPVKPSNVGAQPHSEMSVDMRQVVAGLERLRGAEFWKPHMSAESSFVCLVQVPLNVIQAHESSKSNSTRQTIKKNKKTIKRKHSDKFPDESSTYDEVIIPRKVARMQESCSNAVKLLNGKHSKSNNHLGSKETSPRKVINNSLSKSCVKIGSNSNAANHVLTRSKRSLSFNHVSDHQENGSVDHANRNTTNSTRTLRSNGLKVNCDIKLGSGGKKLLMNDTFMNDKAVLQNNNYNNCLTQPRSSGKSPGKSNIVVDPLLIEEQIQIEEMIAQERKDYLFAKKLQRQLCGANYISTGFTVRTAKKQATLNDILPVAKKMKV